MRQGLQFRVGRGLRWGLNGKGPTRIVRCGSTLWALLATAAMVSVLISGCALESHYKYTETAMETKTFPVEGIEKVEMRLGSADIDVVTKEGPEAEFIIKKTYRSSDKKYGEKLLREVNVTIEREGSTLVVERKEGTKVNMDMLLKGYVSIEITATIPSTIGLDFLTGSGDLQIDDRAAAIMIRTGSGDVTVGSAGAGLDARSGSGDVRLRSAKGKVKASTGSGDLFLGKIEGDTEVSTGSGEISIEGVVGNVTLGTGSGDISVASSTGKASAKTGSGNVVFRGHSGSAEVFTSSGDVAFGISSAEGNAEVRTSSGDIDVTLYGNDSVELDITTMSGSITSKIPIAVKEASRRHLVGISGSGQLKLRLETTSGSVSVTRGSV